MSARDKRMAIEAILYYPSCLLCRFWSDQ